MHASKSTYYALIIALGGFVFGFDASVISGVIGFVTTEFSLSTWQQGFVVSSPTLGAVLGSLCAGILADRFGRKKVLISIAALYVVSAVFSALATTYESLVIARIIGGFAFASLVVAPIYIAEISPAHKRGKMVSFNQLNIVVGISVAFFANYLLVQNADSSSEWLQTLGFQENIWRYMLALEIVPAALFFTLLFFVPESPRWLLLNEQTAKAKKALQRLNGGVLSDSALDAELLRISTNETQESHDAPHNKKGVLKSGIKLLFSKRMRLIVLVGLVAGICQQATGVNAIYFYAPSIFEQSGAGQDAAFSQAVWVGLINLVFTIVAMYFIDKVGRKPLMLVGLVGVAITMSMASYGFAIATYQLSFEGLSQIQQSNVSVDNKEDLKKKLASIVGNVYQSDIAFKQALREVLGENDSKLYEATLIQASININSTLILIGILGFVASFAVSLGPVMWVLLSEIFPNSIRGLGIAFIGLINSGVSFTVQLVFPWELATLGAATTFGIYGGFAVCGFFALYKLLPETKGHSLEEIEKLFVRK